MSKIYFLNKSSLYSSGYPTVTNILSLNLEENNQIIFLRHIKNPLNLKVEDLPYTISEKIALMILSSDDNTRILGYELLKYK